MSFITKYFNKKGRVVIYWGCAIALTLIVSIVTLMERSGHLFASAFIPSHNTGLPSESGVRLEWNSIIAKELYQALLRNGNLDFDSSDGEIEVKVKEWVDKLFESNAYPFLVENEDQLAYKLQVIYGKPNSQENSQTGSVLDFPMSDLEIGTAAEWWIRLYASEESQKSALDLIEYSEFEAGISSSLMDSFGLSGRYAVANYKLIYASSLVDPASLGVDIKPSIPYTYDSSLEQSSIYLETLFLDGWTVQNTERGPGYIDYILEKDAAKARVIVLPDSLKVFYWGM